MWSGVPGGQAVGDLGPLAVTLTSSIYIWSLCDQVYQVDKQSVTWVRSRDSHILYLSIYDLYVIRCTRQTSSRCPGSAHVTATSFIYIGSLCDQVYQLDKQSVSWVRSRDAHILYLYMISMWSGVPGKQAVGVLGPLTWRHILSLYMILMWSGVLYQVDKQSVSWVRSRDSHILYLFIYDLYVIRCTRQTSSRCPGSAHVTATSFIYIGSLCAQVYQVDKQSVSWVRSRDAHILSVDSTLFVSDPRILVVTSPERSEWTLILKERASLTYPNQNQN
jgi:hypothetical protein